MIVNHSSDIIKSYNIWPITQKLRKNPSWNFNIMVENANSIYIFLMHSNTLLLRWLHGAKMQSCQKAPTHHMGSNDTKMGRSLMIGGRKKSWNPERVPSVVTLCVLCVCLCVCLWTGYRSHTPFDLGTQFLGCVTFFFLKIFIFTLFIGIFRFFPYITLQGS